jgi:hypothetical protein
VANYTDFYRLRAGLTDTRDPPPGVRRYDWPSPHQSFAPDAVFGTLGCNGGVAVPLNPLDNTPYLRALLAGMAKGPLPSSRRFVLGRAPATSPYFNGLPGVTVRVPRADRRLQPIGGVRFPELASPLGKLKPVSIPPVVTTTSVAVCGNSGGFEAFSPTTVANRYTKAQYMRRYKRNLKPLLADGLVLRADRPDMLFRATKQYRRALPPRGVP